MLTIKINRRCIGSGNCVAVAPEVFELDLFGKAHVRADRPADVDEDIVLEAARDCPVEAILIERDGQQLFPA